MAVRRISVLVALLIVAVVLGLAAAGTAAYFAAVREPAPWSSSCAASVGGASARVDPEQARNASIIAGVAARRGLAPRAVTIALATAWQESGLRNLGHGDRDSLGLFQQRPSQGWGTEDQIMDPYYAANAFFAAMEKVKGWQDADVGDVAQQVQKSGFPDAYDKHVANSKLLASALSGETPQAFTCALRTIPAGNAAGLASFFTATLPTRSSVQVSGTTVSVNAPDARSAWSAAAIAVANTGTYGVRKVSVAGHSWTPSYPVAASWGNDPAATGPTRVVVETA